MSNPQRGDIIIAERKKKFPVERMQTFRTVVDEVTDDGVACGMDGHIPFENVIRVVGPSPDYNDEDDEFETTVVK